MAIPPTSNRSAKVPPNSGLIGGLATGFYFGWDGKVLVILLGGGTKRRQRNDIEAALRRWRDYKRRKAESRKG